MPLPSHAAHNRHESVTRVRWTHELRDIVPFAWTGTCTLSRPHLLALLIVLQSNNGEDDPLSQAIACQDPCPREPPALRVASLAIRFPGMRPSPNSFILGLKGNSRKILEQPRGDNNKSCRSDHPLQGMAGSQAGRHTATSFSFVASKN